MYAAIEFNDTELFNKYNNEEDSMWLVDEYDNDDYSWADCMSMQELNEYMSKCNY